MPAEDGNGVQAGTSGFSSEEKKEMKVLNTMCSISSPEEKAFNIPAISVS